MPDLIKSLQGKDFGHLRIVAEMWGESLDAPDARAALPRLAALLLARGRAEQVIAELPAETRTALDDLMNHGARLPWALFTRKYGTLREMGAARRDREQPHRSPISPAEMLWYRALLGRAFFDTPNGPEEFAYIPDDLIELLPAPRSGAAAAYGRAASPLERAALLPASDNLLDHACTLLAALRLGLPADQLQALGAAWGRFAPPVETLQALLAAGGLLDPAGMPLPEPTRQWLEASRPEALLTLLRGWLKSDQVNDLRLIPGLKAEGEWQNDPLRARQAVMDYLSTIPAGDEAGSGTGGAQPGPYWSMGAFLEAVRQRSPDFQRTAGDYDSWYLRDVASGEFLRGFANWELVEGALVRYLICGPLHWFGLVDLAFPCDPDDPPADGAPGLAASAFRFSAWAGDLLKGAAPAGMAAEDAAVQVRSDLRFIVPRLAPRWLRYQLSRFSSWETPAAPPKTAGSPSPEEYIYQLTPASLLRARQQGLTTNQLLGLLNRFSRATPPNLVRALERWERQGVEARLQPLVVLRLSTPDLLQTVRASKAARFLGDPLGPTSVTVKPGAVDKVIAILAELGYLADLESP